MIKNEIESTKIKLANLKETYKVLIKDIKETFFEKKEYFVDDSPRKPRNESQKFQAALCLAQENCPRSRYDLEIRKASEWKNYRDKETIWYNYYLINQKRFEGRNGISATIIIRKKNLKLLKEICTGIWAKEVGSSYRPNTILGFEDWLEKVEIDKLYELICRSFNEKNSERIILVNERSLSVKDVVVIFPNKYE
jgi:hypothetical protein